VIEECDDPDDERCDDLCSLRDYAVTQGVIAYPYQSVTALEEDTYTFTLTSNHFVRLDARRALAPQARCSDGVTIGESQLKFSIFKRGDDDALEEVTESLARREDATLCASLQGVLESGAYELRVSGAARPELGGGDASVEGAPTQEVDGYRLDVMLSRELTRGRNALPDSNISETRQPSVFHFTLNADDLPSGSETRRVRLAWPAVEIDNARVDEVRSCPTLHVTRLEEINDLSELTEEVGRTELEISSVIDDLSADNCMVEAPLAPGLYLFNIDTSNSPQSALYVQWAEQCADGQIDPGELCDSGTRGYHDDQSLSIPCSRQCLTYPRDVIGDSVCDRGEDELSSDCELTCADDVAADECINRRWVSGHLAERIVQAGDAVSRFSFEVFAGPTHIEVGLFHCPDVPIDLKILSVNDAGGEPQEILRGLSGDELGIDRDESGLCARLTGELSAGDYILDVEARPSEQDGLTAISYWIDMLKTRSLDGLPELSGRTSRLDYRLLDEPLGDLYTLDLDTPRNLEVSVYDDDGYLQCESLSMYALNLLSRDQRGHLKRTVQGDVHVVDLVEILPDVPTGTGPDNTDIPCARTTLNLGAGRHIFEVRDQDLTDLTRYRLRVSEPRRCGDGRLGSGEQCDDGNLTSGDGCSKTCLEEVICGDGLVSRLEECDDGNTQGGDLTCGSACMRCGDGVLAAQEECDDGNLISGDGCDHLCTREVTPIEQSLFSRASRLSQPIYRELESAQARSLFERADVYAMKIRSDHHLKTWLCTPPRSTREITPEQLDGSMTDQPELLSARVSLIKAPSRDALDTLDLEQELILGEITPVVIGAQVGPNVNAHAPSHLHTCDGLNGMRGAEILNDGESKTQPTFVPPTIDPELEERGIVEQVCLSVTWDAHTHEDLVPGEYWLVVDAQEERPLYRDQTISYTLQTMQYRSLWRGCEEGLGILKSELPVGGDDLFEFVTPDHGAADEVLTYELRTLEGDHDSCPPDTETTITVYRWSDYGELEDQVVTPIDRCDVIYHVPDSACDAARVDLYGGERYLVRVSTSDPTASTRRYGIKARQIERCGNGTLEWGEACDDGNRYDIDTCTKLCTHSVHACGDQEVNGVEQCDDGNLRNGDGCNVECQSELAEIDITHSRYTYTSRNVDPQRYQVRYFASDLEAQPDPLDTQLTIDLRVEPGYDVHYSTCQNQAGARCRAADDDGGRLGFCTLNLDLNQHANAPAEVGSTPSCDVTITPTNMGLGSEGDVYTITSSRRASLSSAGQVQGELLPSGSDSFMITSDEVNCELVEGVCCAGEGCESEVSIRLLTTLDATDGLVEGDDPPCDPTLATQVSVYRVSLGDERAARRLSCSLDQDIELQERLGSVSSSNLCSVGEMRLPRLDLTREAYLVEVKNMGDIQSPYQLQLTYPNEP
jgi:cysteine-rich repeat protein